ncbi:hypothetical protein X946_4758 [Burkholderia sp. ABCPW 111]|nr:hypothetical protein X946_4758 [Burkholderia sp. ABCPW 111]
MSSNALFRDRHVSVRIARADVGRARDVPIAVECIVRADSDGSPGSPDSSIPRFLDSSTSIPVQK